MGTRSSIGTSALCLLLGGLAAAQAQQATERFIPIGESPGVSGEYSYVGEIVAVDGTRRTVTVADEAGTHTLTVTGATNIWLDRSRRRLATLDGGMADCEVGRRVEIMHVPDDLDVALWIKIEAP